MEIIYDDDDDGLDWEFLQVQVLSWSYISTQMSHSSRWYPRKSEELVYF